MLCFADDVSSLFASLTCINFFFWRVGLIHTMPSIIKENMYDALVDFFLNGIKVKAKLESKHSLCHKALTIHIDAFIFHLQNVKTEEKSLGERFKEFFVKSTEPTNDSKNMKKQKRKLYDYERKEKV
jgi:hypothetical protein